MAINFKPSLMQLATKPKATSTPVKIDFKPLSQSTLMAQPIQEAKPGFMETSAFDLGTAGPTIGTVGKTVANQGKSLFTNIWGLIKGVVTSPYTAAKTAWDIGQTISGAQQEGVKFSDILKELPGSTGKVLSPPAVTKGIEAGQQKGIGEGIYQGVKSLAEDPFQLLPYGLMLKGIVGKMPVGGAKLAVNTPKGRIYTDLTPGEQAFFNNEIKNIPQTAGKEVLHLDSGTKTIENATKVSQSEFLKQYPEAQQAFDKFNQQNKLPAQEATIKADNAIIGKILQGKPSDIGSGTRALQLIDIQGIKTYSDLSQVMKSKIENLARAVDEKLGVDETPQTLSELTVKTNVGGKIVSSNYVKMALDGLKEVYQKSNDPANAERINQIIEKADNTGLTAKEVNYIAREFGTEFGTKAFSAKTGEALTSINATGYENIRSGVKNTARQLMPDAGTKAIDKQIADLYNTKRLTDKMVEKVNSLEQRVEKRNWIEKSARAAGIAVDLITFGGVKAFVTKLFFPSNVGLKTLNSLDLEAQLTKNLKIIDKLNNAKTEFEFRNTLTNYIKENKETILLNVGLGAIQSRD
jgi:hypothetical protein